MGQIFSRFGVSFLIILIAAALDVHLLFLIKPHFKETPNTEVWFCLEWMAFVTEGALGILWYRVTKTRP